MYGKLDSTAMNRAGQAWYGWPAVSGVRMGYGMDRDGISIETDLRLSHFLDQRRLVVERWRLELVCDLIGLGHGG